MNGCLVDSDIIIEFLRDNKRVVSRFREIIQYGSVVFYSPVSLAEVYAGMRPAEEMRVAGFFDTMVCVPIDEVIGRFAGQILQRFRKSHSLELGDALIASTCITVNAALWTRNRKHFPGPEIKFFA